MPWTAQQAREHEMRVAMQKRLKSEERTRVSIQSKVAVSRRSYNPKVVTAFFGEYGIPEPIYEHQFHDTRKWRFDIAWTSVQHMVALECQGGLFSGGAHVRGAAVLREHEKYNHACCLGWRILYTTPEKLCTLETAEFVKKALGIA